MAPRRIQLLLVTLVVGWSLALGACGDAAPTIATPSVSYVFDAGVTDAQRAEISSAVTQTSDWLQAEAGISTPTLQIHAAPNGDRFISDLTQRYSITAADASGIRETARHAAGLTVGHDVLLIVDERWQSLGAEKRSFVIAHEIFHVVQFTLASGRASSPVEGSVPGPAWLVEGSADFVAAKVMAASGGRPFDDYSQEYTARAANGEGSLRDLQSVSSYTAWAAESQYTLGFLATQQLVDETNLAALFRVWSNFGNGASWEPAFRNAVGQTMTSFEASFDASRPRRPAVAAVRAVPTAP